MAQRKSNFELLRILAMLMIIDVHYFATCDAAVNTVAWSGNWIVYHLMESFGICGVNLFIFITGFFSLSQDTIKVRKVVNLLIDVAFWGCVGFLICVLVGWKEFGFKSLIKTMFPIFFGGRWFVKAYIILLCLLPFLNIILGKLTIASYRKLLIILTLLFSIWPSFLPNPPIDDYGYGFVHFVLLYVIAGFIRLHIKKYPPKWCCLLGYFICTGIICSSSMLGENFAWAYNYIFVILESVFLFMLFSQLHVDSVAINKIAACAFGVFLIHTDGFFSVLIYDKLLKCNELVSGNAGFFMASALISMPVFYGLAYVLESIKRKIFALSVDRCLNRSSLLNRNVEIKMNSYED